MVASSFWIFGMSWSLKLVDIFRQQGEAWHTCVGLWWEHIHVLDLQNPDKLSASAHCLSVHKHRAGPGSLGTQLLPEHCSGWEKLCSRPVCCEHQLPDTRAASLLHTWLSTSLGWLRKYEESLLHPQNSLAWSGHFVWSGVQIPQADEEIEFRFPTHWQDILITALLY